MNIFLSRIWEWSFDDFRNQIEDSNDKEINVYLACIGGNANAGFAIANYIEAVNEAGSRIIKTHILSNADSIATVIFLAPAPELRSIVQSSQMFKHEPLFTEMYNVNSETATEAAETLEIYAQRIADYYVKKIPSLTVEEARQLMKGEVTLTSNDMIDYGIVNEIKESFDIAALRNNINVNVNYMFGKNKPVNSVSLKQGETEISAIYRGELVESVEIERIGEGDALKGEFVTNDSKLTIEGGKVKKIEAIKAESHSVQNVSEIVADAVEPILDMVENLTSVIEKIKGESSEHVPNKRNVDNRSTEINEQSEAKKSSRERQKANYKKRVENVNQRLKNS